ncbi:fibrinogen alpha chain isoform X2 [Chanos chanos]|nr:fibrinogen alpha chain-like isoform X2 [Chanos chanos]
MRLRKICARTQQYISETTSNMLTTAKVYKAHRKIIVQTHVSELRYVDVAEALHRNLTLLRKRSGELSQKLKELQHLILEQIKEMHRTEVDIDIKIRACQGSCKSTSVYSIDHQYYKSMRDSLAELGQTAEKKRTVFKDTKLQLHPVPAPPVSLSYRMIPIVRKELLTKFEDIEQNQVVLEDIWEDLLNE